MRAGPPHAVAVLLVLLATALAPRRGGAACDAAATLDEIRIQVASLHDTFNGNATLTVPLDLVDDRLSRTEAALTAGRLRKTKGQLRSVIRKLGSFRRRVLLLERRRLLDPSLAGNAIGQSDKTVTVLKALLKGIAEPCSTTTTTVTTTTSTNASNTTVTTTSTKTTRITRPTFPTITLLTIPPRLDYTRPANYGEANLSAGFSPDPYSVGMTTGGGVDVSYLGGSCSGFATSAPDLRINFGGGSSLLRIYFVGSNGDPKMVVNDPFGNFYCVDDSFGTVNPTIDFNNPAGGSYDVWIASFAPNTSISGTLHLTENSGNHP